MRWIGKIFLVIWKIIVYSSALYVAYLLAKFVLSVGIIFIIGAILGCYLIFELIGKFFEFFEIEFNVYETAINLLFDFLEYIFR